MHISEKDFEDQAEWQVQHFVHPEAITIARQYVLPSGRRLDLITAHPNEADRRGIVFTVVELKAQKATVADLLQLLEYVDEFATSRFSDTEVRGILLAPDFESRVPTIAMRMHGIATWTITVEISFGDAPLIPDPGWRERFGELYAPVGAHEPGSRFANDDVRAALRSLAREYWKEVPPPLNIPRHLALVPFCEVPQRWSRRPTSQPVTNGRGA